MKGVRKMVQWVECWLLKSESRIQIPSTTEKAECGCAHTYNPVRRGWRQEDYWGLRLAASQALGSVENTVSRE